MTRIALLGPGTFSEEAANAFFAANGNAGGIELAPHKLIADVFLAVAAGDVPYAVIPIENTIEGSVSLHLDWLIHEVDIPIQAEWVFPIEMNLIGYPDPSASEEDSGSFKRIRKVVSYAVAAAQCRKFMSSALPHAEFEQVSSTAEGARLVKQLGDPSVAAIGNVSAAEIYGLDLLVRGIQDHNNNYTRFILIGEKPYTPLKPSELTKTTILVTLPEDFPGALHQVLSAFAWRRINLSKIESRPTKKKLGSYYFYIDIEAPLDSVLLPAAISEIEALGCQVRVMGSYPVYTPSGGTTNE